MLQSSAFDAWLAWPGIAIGLALVAGSLEFVGPFKEKGWRLAGTIVPIAYTAWSLWLVISGVVLLLAWLRYVRMGETRPVIGVSTS